MSAEDSSITVRKIEANVYPILVIGIFAISSGAIFVRFAQGEQLPSFVIATGRLFFATLLLTPIALLRYRTFLQQMQSRDMLAAMVAGFFLAIHFYTWISSLDYTIVLVSVVIVATSTLWAALLETILLKLRLSGLMILSLVIAVTGSIYIGVTGVNASASTALVQNPNDLLGGTLALAGAISVAVYFVIGRSVRKRVPIVPYIWMTYGFGAIFAFIGLAVTGTSFTGYSPTGYLILFGAAVVSQLVGHSSLNYALAYLPATVVSLASQLEPLGSAILAFLLFQETPGGNQILGSIVILSGIVLAVLAQSTLKTPEKAR